MSKNSIIVVLVGANLFLLASIIFSVSSPPAAMAQRVGGAGNYLIVTGEIQDGYDALYLFDLPQRRLHALTVSKGTPKIQLQDSPDLSADFRAR